MLYRAHRLIWLLFHGDLPKQLDHVDGNRQNNKIENLRECTPSQNQHNCKLRSDNKSGIKGVSWDSSKKMWAARLATKGEVSALGCFWDKEVAGQIVRIERLKLHGEFANNG